MFSVSVDEYEANLTSHRNGTHMVDSDSETDVEPEVETSPSTCFQTLEFPLLIIRARKSLTNASFVPIDANGLQLVRILPFPNALAAPYVFNVVACIIADNCFLTMRGDDRDIASCWLEAPEGLEIQFIAVLCAVREAVRNLSSGSKDLRELICPARGRRTPRLQVAWSLLDHQGESRSHELPVSNQAGRRLALLQLRDVPVGRRVHASFTLWHSSAAFPGQIIVFGAMLERITLL
ncbi:hypothetical protein FA95DRAFT_1608993 [Auriscalpium vulgare]|uniref:Uncharacterized protein n=1 Tax=Auriscalpium vulgare TaxID=40419 RepID=A0ACB8RJ61_9AGAM|nr:hypothetical protein FA95DRAFT_1608993 [Auriscalpium vulgare]